MLPWLIRLLHHPLGEGRDSNPHVSQSLGIPVDYPQLFPTIRYSRAEVTTRCGLSYGLVCSIKAVIVRLTNAIDSLDLYISVL